MLKKRRINFFLLSLILSIGIIFGQNSTTNATESDPQSTTKDVLVSYTVPEKLLDSTEDYWTKERMENAKPFVEPTSSKTESKSTTAVKTVGTIGLIPGKAPLQELQIPSIEKPTAKPLNLNEIKPLANGYDYPAPYTSYYEDWQSVDLYPLVTVGKVFFSFGGYDYVASGSSIGNNAVLTAGHCVVDGGGTSEWYTNWVFVPGYNEGYCPYGIWPAYNLVTSSDWYYNGNLTRDVGFACVSPQNGYKLSEMVGTLGFAWNFPIIQHWDQLGYPAAYPWSGENLARNEASFSYIDYPDSSGLVTIGTGSNLTGGCSGGPWVSKFYPLSYGNCNYANGINSYHYLGSPNEMFSPYFDDTVYSIFEFAIASEEGDIIPPSYVGSSVGNANKRVTLTFSENIVNNTSSSTTLKAAITLAKNGTTYSALTSGDSVSISGNALIIDFATPLSGSNNKIKIKASTLKDTTGNVLASEIITEKLAKVAEPTFNPPAGIYTSPITLNCVTAGAIINYTTDGSTPTSSSMQYTAPITLTQDTTIKAKAFVGGLIDSEIVSASYTMGASTMIAIDNNDSRIIYSGTWSHSSDSKYYNGTKSVTSTAGANAKITLNASKVKIYAKKGTILGKIEVYIDNVLAATVDQYSPTDLYKQLVFEKILSEGSHIIEIRSTGQKNPLSGGYYVNLDYIEYQPSSTSKVSAPTFSPVAGTYTSPITISCATPGATIKYTTDGSNPTITSNTYTTPIMLTASATIRAYAYKSGMTDSDITSATYSLPTSTVVTVDNIDSSIVYSGTWTHASDSNYYNGTKSVTQTLGANAKITFIGNNLKLYARTGTILGIIEVYIDNVLTATIDQYSPTNQYKKLIYDIALSNGSHTIEIRSTGQKNPLSSGNYVNLDYLEYQIIQ